MLQCGTINTSRTAVDSALPSTPSTMDSDQIFALGTDYTSEMQRGFDKARSSKEKSPSNPQDTPETRNLDDANSATPNPRPVLHGRHTHIKVLGSINKAKRTFKRENGRGIPGVETAENPHDYPKPLPLTILTIGLCLSVFLVSLDRTIVATAIPRITDEFDSYDDVGWYGSAYLVTAGALQPLYGRIFVLFNIKRAFLLALATFEVGSFICGIAPNSVALTVGRAVAGWGSAGIITGTFVVGSHAVPLRRRPIFAATVGVMYGIGAVAGPLLGGVFTELVSWRWCFYFNLPVGGATVLSMICFFKPHKDGQESQEPFLRKLFGLDLVGNFILIGASVMLFLALQFQDQGLAWSSSRVIGLLIGTGSTAVCFCLWQRKQGDNALLPPKIILQRSVGASCISAFFMYGAILIHAYYLPIWFQAIKGASALESGIDLLPYILANVAFTFIAGVAVSKIGYFAPPAFIGTAIGTVGSGLLSTLQVSSGPAKWIGYQILASAGFGMAVQQGVIAVQTVLPVDQAPIAIAAVVSMQLLGGAVSVSVGNNILQNILQRASAANRLPDIDIERILAAGATEFRSIVPPESLDALLTVYNSALQKVFIAAVPLSGLAFLAGLAFEWESVRKNDPKGNLEAAITHSTANDSLHSHRSSHSSEEGPNGDEEKNSVGRVRTSELQNGGKESATETKASN